VGLAKGSELKEDVNKDVSEKAGFLGSRGHLEDHLAVPWL
jgi:hypothetical protein